MLVFCFVEVLYVILKDTYLSVVIIYQSFNLQKFKVLFLFFEGIDCL